MTRIASFLLLFLSQLLKLSFSLPLVDHLQIDHELDNWDSGRLYEFDLLDLFIFLQVQKAVMKLLHHAQQLKLALVLSVSSLMS